MADVRSAKKWALVDPDAVARADELAEYLMGNEARVLDGMREVGFDRTLEEIANLMEVDHEDRP